VFLLLIFAACSNDKSSLNIELEFVQIIPQTTLVEYRISVVADPSITEIDLVKGGSNDPIYTISLVDGKIALSLLFHTDTTELLVVARNVSGKRVIEKNMTIGK
jgi:hypothetical protein